MRRLIYTYSYDNKAKSAHLLLQLLVAVAFFSGTITQKVTHHNIEMQQINEKDIASYNWPLQPCVSAIFRELQASDSKESQIFYNIVRELNRYNRGTGEELKNSEHVFLSM